MRCELGYVNTHYTLSRKIHWSGFSSTTTDVKVAKSFCGPSKIIFSVQIINGKDIQKYSVMKGEKEILLHPNMSFVVITEATQHDDGYWYVSLVQIKDSDTFIF